MRWPIILFKESSNQNMSTTTNKDDLVSCSPTQVRHTLRPQDVGSIWCCLCPEMVCPTVCQSVCTRESHYLFRPKRAGAPQVVFVDQSASLFRLVIDHLRLPTELLAKELTGGCDCHHTNTTFWFYRQIMMAVQSLGLNLGYSNVILVGDKNYRAKKTPCLLYSVQKRSNRWETALIFWVVAFIILFILYNYSHFFV